MGINTIPISNRTLPTDGSVTANGSYTLPKYAFIPHPALQQIATGRVNDPTPSGIPTAAFAAPWQTNRPYPIPLTPNVYGIRLAQVKQSPS